jgi:hypothetical protein
MTTSIHEATSKRGGRMIVVNNHIYNFLKNENENNTWRCVNRKCPGRISTDNSNNVISQIKHNHDADLYKVKKILLSSKLREKALYSFKKPLDIVTDLTSELKVNECIEMAKIVSLKDRVSRLRRSVFLSREGITDDIPDCLKLNKRNERFLVQDSGVFDENRMVVFLSEACEVVLKKCEVWLIDGTFKSVPNGFRQLLVIQGLVYEKSFPLCFILAKSQTETIYTNIFTFLKNKMNYSPLIIITDFEKALLNGLKNVYCGAKFFGCTFHFAQAVFRNFKDYGLRSLYNSDPEFKNLIRKFFDLVFIPTIKLI